MLKGNHYLAMAVIALVVIVGVHKVAPQLIR